MPRRPCPGRRTPGRAPTCRPGATARPYHMTDMIRAEPGLAQPAAHPAGRPGRHRGGARRGGQDRGPRRQADPRRRLRHERARSARDGRDPARCGPRRGPALDDRRRRGAGGGAGLRGRPRGRPAGSGRPRHRHQPRGRDVGHEPGPRRGPRGRRDHGAGDRERGLAGGRTGRHRRHDRRARPELVPHGRLPLADPRRGRRRRPPLGHADRRGGPPPVSCATGWIRPPRTRPTALAGIARRRRPGRSSSAPGPTGSPPAS